MPVSFCLLSPRKFSEPLLNNPFSYAMIRKSVTENLALHTDYGNTAPSGAF